ncbi:unnamed protein product [Heterobilharzia americana]|nr:unnamed protein product [Heterobilharzia americana]
MYPNDVLSDQENPQNNNTPCRYYTTDEMMSSIDRSYHSILDSDSSNVSVLSNLMINRKISEEEQAEYLVNYGTAFERKPKAETKQLKIDILFKKLYSVLQDMKYDTVYIICVSCVINAQNLVQHNHYFQIPDTFINIHCHRINDIFETKSVLRSVLSYSEDNEDDPRLLTKAVLLLRYCNGDNTRLSVVEGESARPEGDVMSVLLYNVDALKRSIRNSSVAKGLSAVI